MLSVDCILYAYTLDRCIYFLDTDADPEIGILKKTGRKTNLHIRQRRKRQKDSSGQERKYFRRWAIL